MADFISLDELPRSAAIDTGVMIRAFWPNEPDFATDPRTRTCRAFVTSMLGAGRRVLISAVSIAEALRFPQQRVVPRHRGIEVVAFDDQAAQIFGTKLRADAVAELREHTGARRVTMSVDAMIVACAVRHRAELIVSIDAGFAKLAALAGIEAKGPEDFLVRQTLLDV